MCVMAPNYDVTTLMTRCHFVVRHRKVEGVHRARMIDPDDTGEFAADVARRLRVTRVALGYPDRQQAAFATESGMSQSHYNRFESGARPLTLAIAMKLCHRWGLTLGWMFRGDPSGLPYKLASDIKELRKAEREKRDANMPNPEKSSRKTAD